jgi:hypothetical protein
MLMKGALFPVLAVGWLLGIGMADGQQATTSLQPDQIADTMVRLCVGGGHTEAASGTGSGGADLSLRSLDVTGNLKGEFKVNKSSAEGLVRGLDNAMSQVAADQADKVRVCLQPVRERLLDILLPPRSQSNETLTTGTLIAGHEPSPPTSCLILPDSLTVYFGDNGGAASALSFPHTVVSMYGKDLLVIDRNNDKEIAVNLYVYGDDGRYLVKLINNEFDLNPHNEWTKEETSDRTSLVVYDNKHIKVLDIKYFNEAAVRVMGTFQYGKSRIVINNEQLSMGGGIMSQFCSAASHKEICIGSKEQCG